METCRPIRPTASAVLLLAALAVACGGGDESPTSPDGPSESGSVAVTPDSVRLDTTGGTADFDAAIEGSNGSSSGEQSFRWSVSDSSVASIDADGTVTARDNGVITVEAERNGRTGSATLAVAPVDPLPTNRLVGAVYFGWYGRPNRCDTEPWTECAVSEPTLGAYDALNEKVFNQHVRWALEHGIGFFAMCGCGLVRDPTYFLDTALGDDIDFALVTGPAIAGGGTVDLDRSDHRESLIDELTRFSDLYFGRDNYLRVDGDPVVFVFAAQQFVGDVEGAFREAENAIGSDLYVVAEILFPHRTEPPEINTRILDVADALTSYSPYTRHPDVESVFHSHFETGNHISQLSAAQFPWSFVPRVTPGWNDRLVQPERDNPVLEPSPSRFERVSEQVQPHLRDAPFTVVTSFNEWYEDNQIEPNEQYGEQYLDIVADHLATGTSPAYDPPGTVITIDWGKAPHEERFNPDAGSNRRLSFYGSRMRLLGPEGATVAAYDIGIPDEEPIFASGVYAPERDGDATRRWFGGRRKKTTILAEGVEEVSAVELYGWTLVEMDATVRIGDQADTLHLDNVPPQWWRIEF